MPTELFIPIPKNTKPVQLARIGLIRFSAYFLSAPQADVKSALMRSFRVLEGAVNAPPLFTMQTPGLTIMAGTKVIRE